MAYILAVKIEDILANPGQDFKLETLPESEIIARIRELYSFLSSVIEIEIKDGVAFITLKESDETNVNEALGYYERGVKEGETGNYRKAMKLFKEALAILPNHVDARRNLAMSYLELGNIEEAKNHLIETLRLDPKDVWGYVLLGNIYGKNDKDFKTQERFYSKAYELNPNDSTLLNNFGALKMETGDIAGAEDLFKRAIGINPSYPNTYYGLSTVYRDQKNFGEAKRVLEEMFDKASQSDPRSKPIFEQARMFYCGLNDLIAARDINSAMEFVNQKKAELEQESGFAIKIEEDNQIGYISAKTQMAWRHSRAYHNVRYKKNLPHVIPHIITHELEHIHLEHKAREAGRNRIFVSTAESRELALRSISDHIYKLKEMGYPEDGISQTMIDMVTGLTYHLFNCPLDMIIEKRLFENEEPIRPHQFMSLYNLQLEYLKSLNSKDIKKLTPPPIFKKTLALNCAYCLLIDNIYGAKTNYAEAYRGSDFFETGRALFGAWKELHGRYRHGDEYELIEEFARILKLERWFELLPDELSVENRGGPSNPELLKKKESAVIMYCLGALERLEHLPKDKIMQIASEISILGTKGIDYTNADRRFTLETIPGKSFSGLELLSIMYVAFKKIDPAVDTGLDFKDAYNSALSLYKPKQ
jgi:tetratricopeptide (TPR) repeat protein